MIHERKIDQDSLGVFDNLWINLYINCICCLLFDTAVTFFCRERSKLFSFIVSYKLSRDVLNLEYCSLSIAYALRTDFGASSERICFDIWCTNPGWVSSNGLP